MSTCTSSGWKNLRSESCFADTENFTSRMGITADASHVFSAFSAEYSKTPTKMKAIDVYIIYCISVAVIQFAYMFLVGSFPFNSFLAGVFSCIGSAVLAVCLRMQVNRENKEFKDLSNEVAFADFVLCNLVLHFTVTNFVG
eukprot:TRINITY_DN1182_c3_g1_i1.p2 TRINITY_DN1182_c3_g1~~TRINITY_DN1182_c3_g1_i1.p2  ORF type:complete len:141 (+),score=25.58 TRINITY_DN1182_c3_g1_i1:10-432(+)